HQLGAGQPNWNDPAGRWVQGCERLLRLDQKLTAVLRGTTAPAGPQEQLQLADLCRRYKQLPAAAARFYADAFAAQPSLAANPQPPPRYHAACCAVLAAGGAHDAATLGEQERAMWRRQALDWLAAQLELYRRQVSPGPAQDGSAKESQGFLHQLAQPPAGGRP